MADTSPSVQKQRIVQLLMQASQPNPWMAPMVQPSSGWGSMSPSEPMPINTYGADALFRDAGGTGIADHFTLDGNYKARRAR